MMETTPSDQTSSTAPGSETATLAIAVRLDSSDDERPRAFVAHTQAGVTTTYATGPTHRFELVVDSATMASDVRVSIRTKALDAETAELFTKAMEDVSRVTDAGLAVWTPLRTSSAFAANIWQKTFGEKLIHSQAGLSTPETLARSIDLANARDLGLAHDIAEPIDLELTRREVADEQDHNQDLSQ